MKGMLDFGQYRDSPNGQAVCRVIFTLNCHQIERLIVNHMEYYKLGQRSSSDT